MATYSQSYKVNAAINSTATQAATNTNIAVYTAPANGFAIVSVQIATTPTTSFTSYFNIGTTTTNARTVAWSQGGTAGFIGCSSPGINTSSAAGGVAITTGNTNITGSGYMIGRDIYVGPGQTLYGNSVGATSQTFAAVGVEYLNTP
jgi:hypothetical protein